MREVAASHPIAKGDEGINNHSDNPYFDSILEKFLSRRTVLKGGIGAAVAGGVFAGMPSVTDLLLQKAEARTSRPTGHEHGRKLDFAAVAVSRDDTVHVPGGYTATVFIPWGTPITGRYPEYLEGGLNTGEEQEQQVGMHHDGMHYFPLWHGEKGSAHGLLCVNHEYVDERVIHPDGMTFESGRRSVVDEVRKELAAHGVSVIEIAKARHGGWKVVRSKYNRRITGSTPMELTGPVRGSELVKTRYSPKGTKTRGTLNNCANGYTPWGTYLTCEENWAGYFVNDDAEQPREHQRYGVCTSATHDRYSWHTVDGVDEYARFNASSLGADASEDYRNEPNCFGWVVEIDPFNPKSTPKKRTALGRFAHEGAWLAPVREGQPPVYYMGDDARFEYIYKFVTRKRYHKRHVDRDLLEEGTLYVARFHEDGTGEWIALEFGRNGLRPENGFSSQADVLVNTRSAADFVGATKMDRPEWGAVHPKTGEVYMTLTNNTRRTADAADAANPRGANPYGHIIRWREQGSRPWATSFEWDIFVLAGTESDSQVLPQDGGPALTADSIFASPDGLWIDSRGILWIQTDMSGSQLQSGPFGNNQMLAADPQTGDVRRFLTGVVGCEVTGVASTPDGRTLFVNIQHPGEQGDIPAGQEFSSTWPDGGTARPRAATVIITRDDGGLIGV